MELNVDPRAPVEPGTQSGPEPATATRVRRHKLSEMSAGDLRSHLARAKRQRKDADKLYWPATLEQLRRAITQHQAWAAARYIECELRELKDTESERTFDYWSPLDLQDGAGESILGGGIDDDINELITVAGETVKAFSETIYLTTTVKHVFYIDLLEYKALSLEQYDS